MWAHRGSFSHRSEGAGVLVHGGAGDVPERLRKDHEEGCRAAAIAGRDVLRRGGSALDAVEAAVRALEDNPHFNAGTGACLNEVGDVELDASIMDGKDLRAGAVCAIRGFSAPIAIARAVLEEGRHVLLAAHGAEAFAEARGFVRVSKEILITAAARAALDAVRAGRASAGWAGGTVGAVARDALGHTAAATSTGGMVSKAVGRVGDSPLIGAGTCADDLLGAVSTTGHGEGMIRMGSARAIVLAIGRGDGPDAACTAALAALLARLHVTGGAISVDRHGHWGLARTTGTMSWAAAGLHLEDVAQGI